MKDPRVIIERLNELNKRHEQEKEEALRPAKERLLEIERVRADLDQEEARLLQMLRELGATGVGVGARRRRRASGKRMTALHKKEIIAEFIRDGHITDGMAIGRDLRTALIDRGFGAHDFRKISEYMPAGWEARSNGMRGNAAKTTFHRA